MTLEQAQQVIAQSFAQMNTAYGATLFDEHLVLAKRADGKSVLLDYEGPRGVEIREQLMQDTRILRASIPQTRFEAGDFEFVRHAEGSYFDGVMQLGEGIYLLFGHTAKSMHELTQEPNWKKAQVLFVGLSERFRLDPLAL